MYSLFLIVSFVKIDGNITYSIRDILLLFSSNLISFNSRLLNKSASKNNCRDFVFDEELKELKNRITSSILDNWARNIFEYFLGNSKSETVSKM